jgi:hypothetical protein
MQHDDGTHCLQVCSIHASVASFAVCKLPFEHVPAGTTIQLSECGSHLRRSSPSPSPNHESRYPTRSAGSTFVFAQSLIRVPNKVCNSTCAFTRSRIKASIKRPSTKNQGVPRLLEMAVLHLRLDTQACEQLDPIKDNFMFVAL